MLNETKNSPNKGKKNPKQMTMEELDKRLKSSNLDSSRQKLVNSVSRSNYNRDDERDRENQIQQDEQNDLARLRLNYKYNSSARLYEFEKDISNNYNNNMNNNASTGGLSFSNAFSPINNKNNIDTILTETLLENENEKRSNAYIHNNHNNNYKNKNYSEYLEKEGVSNINNISNNSGNNFGNIKKSQEMNYRNSSDINNLKDQIANLDNVVQKVWLTL